MLSRGKPGLHGTCLDGAGRFSISRVVESGSKPQELGKPYAISWGGFKGCSSKVAWCCVGKFPGEQLQLERRVSL